MPNLDLPGRQGYVLHPERQALADPQSGVGQDGDDCIVPDAAALQDFLPEPLHLLPAHRAGAGVGQLHLQIVLLVQDHLLCIAGGDQVEIETVQAGQLGVDRAVAQPLHRAQIGDVVQHIGPQEHLHPLPKGLLVPAHIFLHALAVRLHRVLRLPLPAQVLAKSFQHPSALPGHKLCCIEVLGRTHQLCCIHLLYYTDDGPVLQHNLPYGA